MLLAGLGIILLSLALVVRFGIINFDRDEDREREQRIAQLFPGSFKSISGLHFIVHQVGEGAEPYPGSIVRFKYRLSLMDGGEIESSEAQGGIVQARVGQPPMLKGLTEGLLGMQVGEKRTLILPPQLAYGKTGRSPDIPPDATLLYDIELVSIEPTN